MSTRSPEERLAELDEKMNQIKAQKRALQNRAKTEERKARTKRLIEVGATLESALEIEITKDMLPTLLDLMKNPKTKDVLVSKLLKAKPINSGNPE